MSLQTTRSNCIREKTEAVSNRGIVSSRHPLSADAGVEILAIGGNAVDTAIAASFAEGVVQPAASTIGGRGLFAVRGSDGQAYGINYMWGAHGAASADMYDIEVAPERRLFCLSGVENASNDIGGLAVATPGSISGLALASGMTPYAPIPGYANSIMPRSRLSSFISPLHISNADGSAIWTTNSSGGEKIMTSVLQIASRILDHGMSRQQAVSYPRIDFEGDLLIVDRRVDDNVVAGLRSPGHVVDDRSEDLVTFEFVNASVLAQYASGTIRGGVNPFRATTAAGL